MKDIPPILRMGEPTHTAKARDFPEGTTAEAIRDKLVGELETLAEYTRELRGNLCALQDEAPAVTPGGMAFARRIDQLALALEHKTAVHVAHLRRHPSAPPRNPVATLVEEMSDVCTRFCYRDDAPTAREMTQTVKNYLQLAIFCQGTIGLQLSKLHDFNRQHGEPSVPFHR